MINKLIKVNLCIGLFITLTLSTYASAQVELPQLHSQTDKEKTDSSTKKVLNAASHEFIQVYQNHCRYLKNLNELKDIIADYKLISQPETQQILLNHQGRGYQVNGQYGTYLLAIADNINMCAVRAYDINIATTLTAFRKANVQQADAPIRIRKSQDSVKIEDNKIITTLAYDWKRNINASFSIEAEEFTDNRTEGKTRLTYRAIMIFNEE